MILHISPNVIFIKQLIGFIEVNFEANTHKYILLQKNRKRKIPEGSKIEVLNYPPKFNLKGVLGIVELIKNINKSDKVILHGLNEAITMLALFITPWNLKKSYWFSWGDDIYKETRNKTIKLKVLFFFKKFVIKRFKYIVVEIDGEYENIKSIFSTQVPRIKSFKYPSNLFKEHSIEIDTSKNSSLRILVGNSGDPSNNHNDIFQQLKAQLENETFEYEIICPLSYGRKSYIAEIISLGISLFGSRFKPITEFLPPEDYKRLLRGIRVAIFNHKRQQAMGNIITLLGMGKKVFIRPEITSWEFFEGLEIKVYSSLDVDLSLMSKKIQEQNILKIKHHFSESRLKSDLETIFNS